MSNDFVYFTDRGREAEMSENEFPMPARADIRLTDVLKALSDPGRLQMVHIMSAGELTSCSPDMFPIGVHKSTLSHHFKTLREAGVTETLRHGRNCSVRLRVDDLNVRFPGLLDWLTTGEVERELERAQSPVVAG
jgi:DNA-binding transcriptional ArsR family regulator